MSLIALVRWIAQGRDVAASARRRWTGTRRRNQRRAAAVAGSIAAGPAGRQRPGGHHAAAVVAGRDGDRKDLVAVPERGHPRQQHIVFIAHHVADEEGEESTGHAPITSRPGGSGPGPGAGQGPGEPLRLLRGLRRRTALLLVIPAAACGLAAPALLTAGQLTGSGPSPRSAWPTLYGMVRSHKTGKTDNRVGLRAGRGADRADFAAAAGLHHGCCPVVASGG
jgi:hypothetical protein